MTLHDDGSTVCPDVFYLTWLFDNQSLKIFWFAFIWLLSNQLKVIPTDISKFLLLKFNYIIVDPMVLSSVYL